MVPVRIPKSRIRRTVLTLKLSLVDTDPGQPRKVFDEVKIRELADSIAQEGLVQLTSVKPNPNKDGRFVIVTGERRFRALQLLGYEEHEFVILEGDLDTSYVLSSVENLNRVDLNPIEEALMFRDLLDGKGGKKLNAQEISKRTGRSNFTIYNRLKLLELPQEVQKMISEERLPPLKALNLRKYPYEDQVRLAHELLSGVSLEMLEAQLKGWRKARKPRNTAPNAPEVLLRRVMEFAWRARSTTEHIRTLSELAEAELRALFGKLSSSARSTLAERYAALADAATSFSACVGAFSGTSQTKKHRAKPAISAPPSSPHPRPSLVVPALPVVVEVGQESATTERTNGKGMLPAKPIREPIILAPREFPEAFGINLKGKAALDGYASVLSYLLGNPKRRGQVNLSKSRLRGVLALPVDRDPEVIAKDALRMAWANWDKNPKHFRPGYHKAFLEKVAFVRECFGETFPDAIANAWMQDISSDPVDLKDL